MAEQGAVSASRIEPLTGSNYHVWALKVSALLRSRKLFKEVIEGREPPQAVAGTNEAKARELWETKNDEAFGTIVISLSTEQAGLFIGQSNAKAVWEELKRIYAGNVEDRKIDIGLELKNIRQGGNESVDTYMTRARSIASRSAALGQVISSREIVYHVVRGLHHKMEEIATVLRPQRAITLEEVQQTLREEEMRLTGRKFNQTMDLSKSERAYKARDGRGGFHNRNSSKKCFICSRTNHLARDCFYRHEKTGTSEYKPKQESFRNRGGQNNQKWERKKEQVNLARKDTREHAFNACVVENVETKLWSLDSGCTSHMTAQKDWMDNMRPMSREICLAEDGRSIQAEAMGNVKLSTITNDGIKNICVKDVLYVPKLRTNLLSIRSLISKGNKIIFDQESARIYNENNDLVAEAVEKDRMYVLETELRNEQCEIFSNCLTAKLEGTEAPLESVELPEKWIETAEPTSVLKNIDKVKWHKRLGHLNENYLDQMKNSEMVKGLCYKPERLGICDSCILGKLSQNPFKQVVSEATERPLEMIHMDICGPMPKKSLGGARYMYVLVDSYSRRVFVYFLKSKEETYDRFVEFKNRRENELNMKIKIVRSDNGTEFVNHNFEQLFQDDDIKHQRTVIYTPQSNGIAERANRSLLDKARTMLIDAKLPIRFWAEAIAVAAYLKNCTPTKIIQQTPMEKWNGRIPNISHLKIFGCLAYYHVPKPHRNKLEPRAKRGIFVGYSQKRKAYRLYNPDEEEVVEVRTAKFDEEIKGVNLVGGEVQELQNEDLSYKIDEELLNTLRPEDPVQSENEQLIPLIPLLVGQNMEQQSQPEQEPLQLQRLESQNRPGRPKGKTAAVIKLQHQQERLAQEERLVEQGVRRSKRINDNQQANVSMEQPKFIPRTYREAIESSHSQDWIEAMNEEVDSLNLHKVWKLTPRECNVHVIKSKWIFTIKENPEGTIARRKARLVAIGSSQRLGIDYEESFSPVMKLESFRTLIAVASHLNLKVRKYDVKTAYLYGELKETIFMEPPEGFINPGDENKICELQRSLYGLPQSGRCWNEKLNGVLINVGMQRLKSDPCIYKLQAKAHFLLMGIYVDDSYVAGTDDDFIDQGMNRVKEYFSMTETPGEGSFLGIEVKETPNGFELAQSNYVDKVLDKYNLSDCNPVKTPGDVNQDLNNSQESPSVDVKTYQEMIGSLMYLSTGTRPDIAYNVSQLSQYIRDPRQIHLTAVKRVYRYLKGTKTDKLVYDREGGKLEISTDASWCSTRDAKSFSGYTVKLGKSLLTWKSRKQNIVALSTCEAELMAMCDGVRELQWITNLLSEIGMKAQLELPLVIKTDSKSAIDWARGSNMSSRTKHINRKFYFIKDEISKGNLEAQFVRSEEMEADLLTKNLCKEKLQACKRMLNLQGDQVEK